MSFITGHYACTWDGTDIGTTVDGFRLLDTNHQEMITTDDFGDAPVDGVVRGTESRIVLDYAEYDLVLAAIIAQPGIHGEVKTNVGLLLTGLAKVLVLTAVAGTPADLKIDAIKTLTASLAIVVSDVETLMAARHRKGPLTFHLLPKLTTPFEAYTIVHGVA